MTRESRYFLNGALSGLIVGLAFPFLVIFLRNWLWAP